MSKKPGTHELIARALPLHVRREDPKDEKFNEKVEQHQALLLGGQPGIDQDPVTLVQKWVHHRRIKKDLEACVKEQNVYLEALARWIHPQFVNRQLKSMVVGDGALVFTEWDIDVAVTDPEANRKWCMDNGLEHKLRLHHGTLESIVKDRLHESEPLPDGVKAEGELKLKLRG